MPSVTVEEKHSNWEEIVVQTDIQDELTINAIFDIDGHTWNEVVSSIGSPEDNLHVDNNNNNNTQETEIDLFLNSTNTLTARKKRVSTTGTKQRKKQRQTRFAKSSNTLMYT